MTDLNIREEKIQSHRKQTERKSFVKEICSRFPLILYKNHGITSKFPENDRTEHIRKSSDFEKARDSLIAAGPGYQDGKPFFDQYADLFKHIGLGNVFDFGGNENSEFTECVQGSKNAYLSFVTILGCENVLYSFSVKDNSVNVFNSVMVLGASNNVYYSAGVKTGYNIFFSKYIYDSSDIRFSANMQNCQECILCDNLENTSYCIRNQKLEKEEYLKQKQEILKDKSQFIARYEALASVLSKNIACVDSDGSFLLNCDNVKNGHMSFNVKNGRNIIMAFSKEANENYADILCAGRSTDEYGGIVVGTFSSKIYNSMMVSNSSNIFYSYGLNDCSYCIGCIGLKNAQFCILNKQYTKEERFALADKIFTQMDKDGTLGQFFPGSMNPFYFNDTAAYLIDDTFTKEEVTAEGYLRRDEEIKVDIPQGMDVVSTKDLANYQGFDSDGNWKINTEILKKVIKDEKGNYYRIVPMELEFLQKYGLPLPEIHWLDRIKLGFKFK